MASDSCDGQCRCRQFPSLQKVHLDNKGPEPLVPTYVGQILCCGHDGLCGVLGKKEFRDKTGSASESVVSSLKASREMMSWLLAHHSGVAHLYSSFNYGIHMLTYTWEFS